MPGSEPANYLRISQLRTVPAPVPTVCRLPIVVGGAVRQTSLSSLLSAVTGGTVTSVSQGVNIKLAPNPITTTGTISFYLPGLIIPYAGSTAPTGWVFCNGESKPITGVYADLWNVVQYRYGGSGSSFNLPDLRGRIPASNYAAGAAGTSGGEENVFLTTTQIGMKSHTHIGSTGFCLNVASNGECCDAGDHKVKLCGAKNWKAAGTRQTMSVSDSLPVNPPQSPSSGHNNMPPGLILNYLIKL
jgi:microcystin-dependent protein